MAHTNNAFKRWLAGSLLPTWLRPCTSWRRSRVARCPRPFSGHTSLALHHRGDSKLLTLSHAIHLPPGDSVFGGKPLKWTFRVGDQPPTLGQGIWEADLERKQEFRQVPESLPSARCQQTWSLPTGSSDRLQGPWQILLQRHPRTFYGVSITAEPFAI